MVNQAIAVQTEQIGGKITFDEFLRLPDDLHAELVDGEVIELMPPSIKHNDLAAFLFYFMLTYIGYRSVGRVFHAPTALKLLGRAHGREPDLMYVRREHADRVKDNYVESPADAVFEIVSPESIERDYNDKFNEYQAAGIPEYWLIDPAAQRVRLYHLNATGKYEVISPTEDGHQYSTEISGFYLPVALLWQDPLPNPIANPGNCQSTHRAKRTGVTNMIDQASAASAAFTGEKTGSNRRLSPLNDCRC